MHFHWLAPHVAMFLTLGFLILFYLKLSDQLHIKWIWVFLPLSYFIKVIATKAYFYISPLKDSHKQAYQFLVTLLVIEAILLIVFAELFASYLDQPFRYENKLALYMIPLELILLSTFVLFVYLLPGLCDPENNVDRRCPFLIMLYYLTAFALVIIVSINESVLTQMNGLLLFFPVFAVLFFHIITILSTISSKKHEIVLLLMVIVECIIVTAIINHANIPLMTPFVIGTIMWLYVYYNFVGFN